MGILTALDTPSMHDDWKHKFIFVQTDRDWGLPEWNDAPILDNDYRVPTDDERAVVKYFSYTTKENPFNPRKPIKVPNNLITRADCFKLEMFLSACGLTRSLADLPDYMEGLLNKEEEQKLMDDERVESIAERSVRGQEE